MGGGNRIEILKAKERFAFDVIIICEHVSSWSFALREVWMSRRKFERKYKLSVFMTSNLFSTESQSFDHFKNIGVLNL